MTIKSEYTAMLFIAAEKRAHERLQSVGIDIYGSAVYWCCNNI